MNIDNEKHFPTTGCEIEKTLDSIEIEAAIDDEITRLTTVCALLEWGAESDALIDAEIAVQNLAIIKERMRISREI